MLRLDLIVLLLCFLIGTVGTKRCSSGFTILNRLLRQTIMFVVSISSRLIYQARFSITEYCPVFVS